MSRADDADLPTVHEVLEEADGPSRSPSPSRALEPEPEPERTVGTRAEAGATAGQGVQSPTPQAVAAAERQTRSGRRDPVPEASDDEIWESEPDAPRVRPVQAVEPGRLPERRVVVIDENADLGATGRTSSAGEAGSRREAEASIGATLHDDDDGQKRRWRLFRKGGE